MKNNLYALGLSVGVALYGGNAESKETETLEQGMYHGVVDGIPAEYEVTEGRCILTLHRSTLKTKITKIYDNYCDHTADGVDGVSLSGTTSEYTRADLMKAGRTGKFDAILRKGHKLVRPVKDKKIKDIQKELDDLLKPYMREAKK